MSGIETIINNVRIAYFMGNKRNGVYESKEELPLGMTYIGRQKHWHFEGVGWFDDEQLLYHKSWDWLIPVYNRIRAVIEENDKVREHLKNDKNYVAKFGCDHFFHTFENKVHISGSYCKVVYFLDFYDKIA